MYKQSTTLKIGIGIYTFEEILFQIANEIGIFLVCIPKKQGFQPLRNNFVKISPT